MLELAQNVEQKSKARAVILIHWSANVCMAHGLWVKEGGLSSIFSTVKQYE